MGVTGEIVTLEKDNSWIDNVLTTIRGFDGLGTGSREKNCCIYTRVYVGIDKHEIFWFLYNLYNLLLIGYQVKLD